MESTHIVEVEPLEQWDLRQSLRTSKFGWWLAALLCVAGGVLTKWTGFLFFYAMAIPFLVWRRQLRLLFRWQHLVAAAIGAGLVWIWLGMVIEEFGWSYVWSALWREGAPRVLAGKSPHQQLLLETLLHPFKVLAICLPWSLFALYGIWRTIVHRLKKVPLPPCPSLSSGEAGKQRVASLALTSGERRNLVEGTLLCWAVIGTVMMTLFPDHNTRQSFALVPAWTLLGVLQIRKWVSGQAMLATHQSLIKLGLAILLIWCLVKIAYVEILVPARYRERPRLNEQADLMREFVPAGETLYLQAVKDECLMFTYGHRVRRVASWKGFGEEKENSLYSGLTLPSQSDVVYCILTERERETWSTALLQHIAQEKWLLDAQGDPLILVQLRGHASP